MKLGIVGAEEAKFTTLGKERAVRAIHTLCDEYQPEALVSGGCHLGGIDIWTEEVAHELGIPMEVFRPKRLTWEGGYKQRNLLIAHTSDVVVCITVDRLPPGFKGMRFAACYHCDSTKHVKSGGCWTALRAKAARWIVIANEESE